MIIISKFASRCPKCACMMSAGTKVEWTKGHAARHVGDCQRMPDRGVELRKHIDGLLNMLKAGTATICTDAIRDHEVYVRLPDQTVARIERDERTESILAAYIAAAQKGE